MSLELIFMETYVRGERLRSFSPFPLKGSNRS